MAPPAIGSTTNGPVTNPPPAGGAVTPAAVTQPTPPVATQPTPPAPSGPTTPTPQTASGHFFLGGSAGFGWPSQGSDDFQLRDDQGFNLSESRYGARIGWSFTASDDGSHRFNPYVQYESVTSEVKPVSVEEVSLLVDDGEGGTKPEVDTEEAIPNDDSESGPKIPGAQDDPATTDVNESTPAEPVDEKYRDRTHYEQKASGNRFTLGLDYMYLMNSGNFIHGPVVGAFGYIQNLEYEPNTMGPYLTKEWGYRNTWKDASESGFGARVGYAAGYQWPNVSVLASAAVRYEHGIGEINVEIPDREVDDNGLAPIKYTKDTVGADINVDLYVGGTPLVIDQAATNAPTAPAPAGLQLVQIDPNTHAEAATARAEKAVIDAWLAAPGNREKLTKLEFAGDISQVKSALRYVPLHTDPMSWAWRGVLVVPIKKADGTFEEAILMSQVGNLTDTDATNDYLTAAKQPLTVAEIDSMFTAKTAQNTTTVITQAKVDEVVTEFKTEPLVYKNLKPSAADIAKIKQAIAANPKMDNVAITLAFLPVLEEPAIRHLIKVATKLTTAPFDQINFNLEGHTNVDGYTKNKELSERRAQAVQLLFLAKGIAATRIGSVAGFGQTKPQTGMQGRDIRNKRVEFVPTNVITAPGTAPVPGVISSSTPVVDVKWNRAVSYRILKLNPEAIADYKTFEIAKTMMTVQDVHIVFNNGTAAVWGDRVDTVAYTPAAGSPNVPAQVYGYESWNPIDVTPPPAPTGPAPTAPAPSAPAPSAPAPTGATAPQNYQEWQTAFNAAKAELGVAIAAEESGQAIANYITANPVTGVTKDNVDSKIQGLEAVLAVFAAADSKLNELYRAASTAEPKQFADAPVGTTEQAALDAYKVQIEAVFKDTKYDALRKLIAPYFKAIMEKKITFALALTLNKTTVKLPRGKGTVSLSYTRTDTATNVLLQIKKQGTTFTSNIAAHDETAKTFSFEADAPGKFEILRTTFIPGIGVISVVVAVVEVKKTGSGVS